MSTTRGVVVGSFGLITLYNIVSPKAGSGVWELFSLPARLARWLVSPTVPLIPDRTGGTSGGGLSGTWIGPATTTPGIPN